MEALAQILSALFAGGALVGVLAYFKRKPGQRERDAVAVAEGEVNVEKARLDVAKGTFELVTTELEDQFKRMAAEVKELHQALVNQRHEEALYRVDIQARLDELGVQLRAEKAEKEQVKLENEHLKARVKALEAEVRALKAAATRTT